VQAGTDPTCIDTVIDTSQSGTPDAFHLWGSVMATVTPPFAVVNATSVACPDIMVYYKA